jgi:hypothetical protein
MSDPLELDSSNPPLSRDLYHPMTFSGRETGVLRLQKRILHMNQKEI